MNKNARETAIVDALERFGPCTIIKLGAETRIDHTTLHADLQRLEMAKVAAKDENPDYRHGWRSAKHIWRLT